MIFNPKLFQSPSALQNEVTVVTDLGAPLKVVRRKLEKKFFLVSFNIIIAISKRRKNEYFALFFRTSVIIVLAYKINFWTTRLHFLSNV